MLLLASLLLTACSGSAGAPPAGSPSASAGGMSQGLIAYAAAAGIGVLDPTNGKSAIVAPLPAGGAFRVAGPVWGPAPGLDHPVLYFTIHDDRPPERRTTAGVVPYDWLFRVDPFSGTIDPIAASMDSTSEGPIGLVANSQYLGLSVGCCTTYEVDALDLTKPAGPLKVLSKPPAQTAFFTEGAAPGSSGLLAVRAFGTGAWYWLNADAGVVNPFPIKLGVDDGPIAFSPDGTMVAVANIDHGAVIEPINSELPLGSPSTSAAAVATPSVRPSPTGTGVKHVNSKLPHPDGLSWSPDGAQLAVAVNGEVELYKTSAPDGPPASRYLAGGNVVGVSWSAAITGLTFDSVKASKGPQTMVDALLAATKLPAQADTPANRPLTKIYLWQFDSSKTSPIESIADAQPDTLAKYPPINASVVFHHWAPTDTWAMLGGCYRYRVVIAGSVTPTAFTFGLASNTLCSAKPTPTLSPSPSHS